MEKSIIKERRSQPGTILSKEQLKKCLGGVVPPEDTYICGATCGEERIKYSSSTPCEIFTMYAPNGNSGNSEIKIQIIFAGGSVVDACSSVVPIIHQA